MAEHFDFISIGGGSGGLAAAQRAAMHGARSAVIESGPLGGTCVNVGCVPKKVMWHAAQLAHQLEDARDYGFTVQQDGFDWGRLKSSRDEYVARLNGIYERNLERRSVTLLRGQARLSGSHSVTVDERTLSADHIVIATGGHSIVPSVPGAEAGIDSDGFFALEKQPRRVAVIGSGYIAVELAGVFRALGSEVTLLIRFDSVLRSFDEMLRERLMEEMRGSGIEIVTGAPIERIEEGDSLAVITTDGRRLAGNDCVLWAVGRGPNTQGLGLDAAGLKVAAGGFVETDEFQNTAAEGIYAIGDVTGRAALTPVAIAAGRRLADRLFAGMSDRRLNYDCIPSVIFSHPPVGTVGLSEAQARARHGDDVRVYQTSFVPLYHQITAARPKVAMKLVTTGPEERILGCHVIGEGADEMLQGFAVAVRMGATKADFDETVAIHPTAAEEFVTMS